MSAAQKTGGMRYRFIEGLKTLLIFVLIVVMIVLLILLMVGQGTSGEGGALPSDRMVVYTTGAETGFTKGMDTSRVLPSSLLFCENGGEIRCLVASGTMEKPYTALYTPLRTLFGAMGICTRLDKEAGEALWARALLAGDFIALTYEGALPPAVIRAYTFAEEVAETENVSPDETPSGDTAYIKYLILVAYDVLFDTDDGGDAVCAVARDLAGTTAVFSTLPPPTPAVQTEAEADVRREARITADNALTTYTAALAGLAAEAQTVTFSTATEMLTLSPENNGVYRLPALTLSVWDPTTALFSDGASQDGIHDSDIAGAFLELLGTDARDTDNYYTDNAGGRVYLNADGRLWLSRGGRIRYTASGGGGIPIADYLGYASVGSSYLLSEYLRAADRLLSRLDALDSALGGGDADISLYAVNATEDTPGGIRLRYVYTYNGIVLTEGSGAPMYALTLDCANGCVMALDWGVRYAVRHNPDDAGDYLLPQSVARAALRRESPDANIPADAVMRLCYISDVRIPDRMHAAWVIDGRSGS